MDAFALNGAPINGQETYDVTLEGNIGMSLPASGVLTMGAVLSGQSSIHLDTAGDVTVWRMLAGTTHIELDAQGQAFKRAHASGDCPIGLQTGGYLSLGLSLRGGARVDVDGVLDLLRRAMGQGAIDIALHAVGEGSVRGNVFGEGHLFINLEPITIDGRRTQAHLPALPLNMTLGASAGANLWMHDVAGTADIVLDLIGNPHAGSRVALEGNADIYVHAFAESRRYALVHLQGATEISFDLISNVSGWPDIPTDYVPAPDNRRMQVPKERRAHAVHHIDRRL